MSAGTPTYPVDTIAKLLMLSPRRVQQLTKEGVVPKAEHGRYELAPAVQGYIRYLQARHLGKEGDDGAENTMASEKIRLTRAQADKAEIEAAIAKGDAHRAGDVAREVNKMLEAFRARMLSIPTKTAPVVQHEQSLVKVEDAIRLAINEALAELSNYDPARFAAPAAQ